MFRRLMIVLLALALLPAARAAGEDAPPAEPDGLMLFDYDGPFITRWYEDMRWAGFPEVRPERPEDVELIRIPFEDSHGGYSADTFAYVVTDGKTAQIVDVSTWWNVNELPCEADGLPVTAIGRIAQYAQADLPRGLQVPASVTQIAEQPLLNIVFSRVHPDNPRFAEDGPVIYDRTERRVLAWRGPLPEDGEYAVPAGTERVASYAFRMTKLRRITLPEGLVSIGTSAFELCSSLTEINIPDSVTRIEGNPFPECMALERIAISPDHPVFGLRDGVLYRKADNEMICALPGVCRGDWTVPAWVRSLAPCALAGQEELTRVRLPEGLHVLPGGAFAMCGALTEVAPLEGVRVIGERAFEGCRSMTEITLPESLTVLGAAAFSRSGLTSVRLPEAAAEIGPFTFFSSDLREAVLPDGMREIPDGMFASTPLERLTFPAEVRSIGKWAFMWCYDMTEMTIPAGVTAIGSKAFAECSLTKVTIPDSVTSIGKGAFEGCRYLTAVTIPGSVTAIGEDAFSVRSADGAVIPPPSLTVIAAPGSMAEAYCLEHGLTCVPEGE